MNNIQICECKRGRPQKKDYDPETLMKELVDTVAEVYNNTNEIKATAIELALPPQKVKKLLITGKVISYPETEQILSLQRQGRTMEEIENIMGLSYSTINTYLPYSKVIYKLSEISQNAERVRRYTIYSGSGTIKFFLCAGFCLSLFER